MNLTGLAAKTHWAQGHINRPVFLTGYFSLTSPDGPRVDRLERQIPVFATASDCYRPRGSVTTTGIGMLESRARLGG